MPPVTSQATRQAGEQAAGQSMTKAQAGVRLALGVVQFALATATVALWLLGTSRALVVACAILTGVAVLVSVTLRRRWR